MLSKMAQSNIISRNIKKLRNSFGWNQSKLAGEAGITTAALSKIEKGDGRVSTIIVLREIASALKVPLSAIIDEESENLSQTNERNCAFYRQWGMLGSLSPEDQEILKRMAERLGRG